MTPIGVAWTDRQREHAAERAAQKEHEEFRLAELARMRAEKEAEREEFAPGR